MKKKRNPFKNSTKLDPQMTHFLSLTSSSLRTRTFPEKKNLILQILNLSEIGGAFEKPIQLGITRKMDVDVIESRPIRERARSLFGALRIHDNYDK